MRRQANRLRNLSERIVTEVEVGKIIPIPIPMVDHGKSDPRNLLVVVLSREEYGYKLGTKSGVLRGLYTRSQFELSDNNFLAKNTVQLEMEISPRQAVSDASIHVMAKALQSVVVVLVGSPDATRKDVCVEKMD
jgi:hypothetical protein